MVQRVCTFKVMITISNLLSKSVILKYIISFTLGISKSKIDGLFGKPMFNF